jgi:hypothetical protein
MRFGHWCLGLWIYLGFIVWDLVLVKESVMQLKDFSSTNIIKHVAARL